MSHESSDSHPHTSFNQFLNKQRNERDEENDENGQSITSNPIHDWREVVTTEWEQNISNWRVSVVSTNDSFVGHGVQVSQDQHETLQRQLNKQVIDVETRVTIVERQESVQWQLSRQVVVFSGQHLFTHTSTNLGCEIQNRTETHISTLTTSVVFTVLDSTTSQHSSHTGVNIFIQVQTLLSLRNTTSGKHESSVQEIRVTIMQFTTNLSQSSCEQGTESLFFTSSNITQNTRVLGENVFTSTQDSNREGLVLLRVLQVWSVRVNMFNIQFFEFSQKRSNLQTFFQIVVLISIDQLNVFTTVENNSMISVIRFTITQDWVTRQLNSEFRTTSTIVQHLTMTINQSGVDSWFFIFVHSRFFVQVSNLNNKSELSSSHLFQCQFQTFWVTTEVLNQFRVFNTVQQLDSSSVVHETRNSTVQGSGSQRSPDTSSQGVFRSSRFETNTVEWQVINLRFQVVISNLFWIITVFVCSSFFSQNLGVLDETLPFNRMQLLQVFQQSNSGELVIFSDNFSQRQKNLFGVVRSKHSEGRHVVDWSGQRLSKERDSSFGFRVSWEELSVKVVVILRDKESWSSQNRDTQVEGSTNGENTVTDNVPHVSIQEEQQHVNKVHQTQDNLGLLKTKLVTKPNFTGTSHLSSSQNSDRISNRQNQEEIRFNELGKEN